MIPYCCVNQSSLFSRSLRLVLATRIDVMSGDPEKHDLTSRVASPSSASNVFKAGGLAFVAEQGGNGSLPTYQEATGAPIEQESPLGYKVQWFTIIFLNIGQMIGTGVFSTRTLFLPSFFPPRRHCRGVGFLQYAV